MSALGVDTRSDIYSLGVLLYELLTGSTPLSHKRVREAAYGEVLRMIKEEEPPRPSTRLSDSGEALASISAQRHMEPAKLTKLMRGELDWIVMKTLEKDRNRRYETANGFAADVQRYLDDEPVQACPPSTWYRFRKFARHNQRAVATAAAVALVVVLAVLGLATSTLLLARTTGDGKRAPSRDPGQGRPGECPLFSPHCPCPPRAVRGQLGPRRPIPRGVPERPARLGVALPHAALPGRAVDPPGQARSQQPGV